MTTHRDEFGQVLYSLMANDHGMLEEIKHNANYDVNICCAAVQAAISTELLPLDYYDALDPFYYSVVSRGLHTGEITLNNLQVFEAYKDVRYNRDENYFECAGGDILFLEPQKLEDMFVGCRCGNCH